MLKTLLPDGSGIVPEASGSMTDVDDAPTPLYDSEPHFETSNDAKSAAEKHAFLHSHVGLEDVF